ncbi:MAG TPA: hypothetical protein VFB33_17420 [Candidatus Binataceae bacterium]|nr:hypothetical protein [Candidatus Binataceae bacterium]
MAERDVLWVLNPAGQRASGEWIDDTLRERAAERGMLGKLWRAADFPRQRVEVIRAADPFVEVNDLFYRRGWTDGLPIVPPTLGRVEEMLARAGRGRNDSLGELDPLRGLATIEKVAANAVMAGCGPEHLPVVLAAVEAIAEPEFNLRGVQTTDENVAPLLIVSGPAAAALEINAGFGALGPGWRANATIGRALRLVMNNIGGGWPGAVSLAGLGSPARYTLCLAENAAQSPWPPLHVELGLDKSESVLVVMRAECAINLTGGLEEIASVMGSATSAFTMLHEGKVAVALAPYVARRLAEKGLSKDDVKRRLFERGRMAAETLKHSWLWTTIAGREGWPRWVREAVERGAAVPAVRAAEDITLIVAGGDLEIPQHAYFPSWGFPPCRIVKMIHVPR